MCRCPLASLLVLGAWLAAIGAEAQEGVDTHTHLIYMVGRGGKQPGTEEYRDAARELIAQMDQWGMRKAILLSPPAPRRRPGRGGESLSFVDVAREIVRLHPDRLEFLGGGDTLNATIQTIPAGEVTAEVKAEFTREAESIVAKGARGFGEMTALHLSLEEQHPFEEVSPDHPLFLLLAEIAARHDVPIDLHMDAIPEDMDFPAHLERIRALNPARLKGNLKAFARLLAHDRKARIVWQHAGTDPVGGMHVERLRELLGAHPNLYVGLRVPFERSRENMPVRNAPVDPAGKIRADWLALFTDFPDRFMAGSDAFIQGKSGGGARGGPQPFAVFAVLRKLPPDLAAKIGGENATRVYRLKH